MENLFNEVNISSGHQRSYGSRIMSGTIRVRYKGKRTGTGSTSYSVSFSKGRVNDYPVNGIALRYPCDEYPHR